VTSPTESAAIDHLAGLGYTPGVILGNCSGAYQAFQALAQDARSSTG
jgi:hypothetical protein